MGRFLIVAWVVMWGHVLGYVVPRGHIMGSAGLVIRYDVKVSSDSRVEPSATSPSRPAEP